MDPPSDQVEEGRATVVDTVHPLMRPPREASTSRLAVPAITLWHRGGRAVDFTSVAEGMGVRIAWGWTCWSRIWASRLALVVVVTMVALRWWWCEWEGESGLNQLLTHSPPFFSSHPRPVSIADFAFFLRLVCVVCSFFLLYILASSTFVKVHLAAHWTFLVFFHHLAP